MLMQPSPIAETPRLLFPSLRFCIVSPSKPVGLARHTGAVTFTVIRKLVVTPSALSSAWTVRRSPLAWRRSLPLEKCKDKGVGIFVSQQIGSVGQLERGLAQVVLCHFPPGLLDQAVKRNSFFKQAPLQSPGADVQFESSIFQSRFLTCKKPLQDSRHLFLERLIRE